MDSQALLRLKKIIREKSYREGQFKLASGKTSSFYIDMKATTLHPEGAFLTGQLMAEAILESQVACDAVGGMTLGADPIATAVSLAAWQKKIHWPAFIVRKEAKDHGTARFLEGTENLKPGASLVVLEDVVTTGGTSLKAIERIREAGFRPTAVITIVDRETGGREAFEGAGLRFLRLATLQEIQATTCEQERLGRS